MQKYSNCISVIAFHGNPSQHYGASPAIWDHTVLTDTGECTPPWLQLDRLVLDLPTLEGWKAELILVAGYVQRWFTSTGVPSKLGTS